ncbi:hypothetical protein D3C78_1807240 [compost metagenome]
MEAARQGAVQPVYQQRDAEPQQTGLGTVVDQRQQSHQGEDHAAGGHCVDAPGLGLADMHRGDGQIHGTSLLSGGGYINV